MKPLSRVTGLRTNITAWSGIEREALHQSQMRNPQLVPQSVRVSQNGNSVQLSPAASEGLRVRQRCSLNLPVERYRTVKNPGSSDYRWGQYHKQEFQLRTNILDPHTHIDLNTVFSIYLPPAEIKQSFAHPCVDALRNVWGYWWERVLLDILLVTILSFHQSTKIQTGV